MSLCIGLPASSVLGLKWCHHIMVTIITLITISIIIISFSSLVITITLQDKGLYQYPLFHSVWYQRTPSCSNKSSNWISLCDLPSTISGLLLCYYGCPSVINSNHILFLIIIRISSTFICFLIYNVCQWSCNTEFTAVCQVIFKKTKGRWCVAGPGYLDR